MCVLEQYISSSMSLKYSGEIQPKFNEDDRNPSLAVVGNVNREFNQMKNCYANLLLPIKSEINFRSAEPFIGAHKARKG